MVAIARHLDGYTSTRDYFYTSGWQCIEEQVTDVATTTTTLDHEYVWGLRYIDDLVRRDRDTTGNGTLDEQLFALNDRQFNVVALWDATAASGAGAIVERFTYDPYGTPIFLNENFTTKANSTYDWDTLFQGLHRDQESNLYNNRARILHPLLGRFLQRDPLGYPDGLNAYAAYHVMRNGVDPSGREVDIRESLDPNIIATRGVAVATGIIRGDVRYEVFLEPGTSDSNCCVAKLVSDYLLIVTVYANPDSVLRGMYGLDPADVPADDALRIGIERTLERQLRFERRQWQATIKGAWERRMAELDGLLSAIPKGDCLRVFDDANKIVDQLLEKFSANLQVSYELDTNRWNENHPNNKREIDPNYGSTIVENRIEAMPLLLYG